jgi:hypothetical protein
VFYFFYVTLLKNFCINSRFICFSVFFHTDRLHGPPWSAIWQRPPNQLQSTPHLPCQECGLQLCDGCWQE